MGYYSAILWIYLASRMNQNYYARWEKPDTKDQTLYDSICIKFWKSQYNNDEKQISNWQGLWAGEGDWLKRGTGNFLGWWKFSILCLWWWLYVYTSVKTHQITHLKLVNLLYVIPQLCWFKIKKWISVQSFQIITTCESVQFYGVLMFWEALSPASSHIFFLSKQKILNNVKLRDGYRGVFFTVCARWYLEN